MPFFCLSCKSSIEPKFKACPFCGEPITDFMRKHLETPIDGKYQILSRLGIGGMGEVYKVLHIHLNSIRVIKMMRPNIVSEEGAHERFIREARLATRINHPNVAVLFDFSALEDQSYYMVWEYIEGTNLTELIRARGALSPKYAAELASQALLGLDAVHRAGVVHRDISPENIMITRDEEGEERVKIIDLGIAKQWGDAADDKTKTGMFVGKWKYCSPEHLGMLKEGERIDGRADLYSFGIVLYEMLSGNPPFLADTPHRYLLMHASETPRPLRQLNPALESCPELEALVFKALEKDRTKRFATAREFAKALQALIPSLPDQSAPVIVATRTEETTQERPLVPTDAAPVAATQIDQNLSTAAETRVTPIESTAVATVEAMRPDAPLSHPEEDVPVERNRAALWMAAAAAVVIAIAGLLFWTRGEAPGEADIAASPTQTETAVTEAAIGTGVLGLNAFPWGEVVKITDLRSGTNVAIEQGLTTPAAVDLREGRYEIELAHPEFSSPLKKTVEIRAGRMENVMVQFATPSEAEIPDFGGTE